MFSMNCSEAINKDTMKSKGGYIATVMCGVSLFVLVGGNERQIDTGYALTELNFTGKGICW